MKFSSILSTFALATAAPAADPSFSWSISFGNHNNNQVSTRNSTECVAYINTQAAQILQLTQTIGNISDKVSRNDIVDLLKLQTNTQSLIDLIKETGSQINSTCGSNNSIGIAQALPLVTTLGALADPINATMTSLVDKKDTFDHAILYLINLSWLVKADLKNVLSAVEGMVGAITVNVDKSAAGIVSNIASKLIAPISTAKGVYDNWLGL